LSFVKRNFNFVGFLVGRIKEVFLRRQSPRLSVRSTKAAHLLFTTISTRKVYKYRINTRKYD
ncbi:MAG: hypothetical protein KJ770_02360, partial [Actinobacteria bacterium]|nr:hypothetical protein [Actinomycetota bacterium]